MIQLMASAVDESSKVASEVAELIKSFLDSGATDHIVRKKKYFSKYVKLKEPEYLSN